jgi:hypothetical protein
MAYKMSHEISPDPTEGPLEMLNNVNQAVGANAPNRTDDILLVQYFLTQIYSNATKIYPPIQQTPDGDLPVDGNWSSTLASWILNFQTERSQAGWSMWPDGRVDPIPDVGNSTPIHNKLYTIYWLNYGFALARPDVDYKQLELEPSVPQALADALSRNASTYSPTFLNGVQQ